MNHELRLSIILYILPCSNVYTALLAEQKSFS
jgi:hypothetical protein